MIKFGSILTLIFLVLKLIGYITWSWLLVILPMPVTFLLQFVGIVAYIFMIEIWGTKEERIALRIKGYLKW